MRTESPARAKSSKGVLRFVPREGTKLRELYDLLQSRRGLPIEIPITRVFPISSIAQLTDFYGLDIRRLGPGYKRWILAGEWFGLEYRDYIAARLQEAE